MKNRFKLVVFLVVLISLALPMNVYADEVPNDVGFVEKALVTIVNKIASAIDIEDFSIDHLIYGKSNGNARPSTWTKSKYAFNPVNGNLFYDIYRGSYGVFRNLGIILVNLYIVYLATKGLYSDATSKDYFKSGILTLVGTTLLFTSLPGILDFVLMLRENLLDFIYPISAGLSGTGGGGFIEGLRDNASSDTATLKDSLFYLAGVILNLYFLFIYISMGVSFVLCMWLSPILITTSEQKLKEKITFFKYTAGIIITPVIDAALLIMPLVVVSKSEGVLIAIATFAAIIPTRTWLRKQLGLGTGVSEMMGMGFAFMGGQMVGSAVGGVIGAGRKITQGYEHVQKANMFKTLAKEESGLGSNSDGNQFFGDSINSQTAYASMNSNSPGIGSYSNAESSYGSSNTSNSRSGNPGNNYSYGREQTDAQAKLVAKYGHKGWFKESGIQMTNEQRYKAEAANAAKSVSSAALGLAGRAAGMSVGASIMSGYGVGGVALGSRAGGDIGDAVGSKIGESFFRAKYLKNNYSDSPIDTSIPPYRVNPTDYHISHEPKNMISGGEGDVMIGNSTTPLLGGGGGGSLGAPSNDESVEVRLMAGFNDFKIQNETTLRADYNNSVPNYANAVMDSNKDVLMGSAMESLANNNIINKNSNLFKSPVIRNKAHDVAKQQVVNSLLSGQNNEQFRDTFAKQVHSQEVSKVVTGETKIKAEELANVQLNQFSNDINSFIEGSYQNYIIDYMQTHIIENEKNGE